MWVDRFPKDCMPQSCEISEYINSEYWETFLDFMRLECKIQPKLEYSSCSMEKGWNLKFKRKSRNMCTVYPKAGYFRLMIAMKASPALQSWLDTCCPKVREIYEQTPFMNGSKWLIFDIMDNKILHDCCACIKIKINECK